MIAVLKTIRWYHRLWHKLLVTLGKEACAFNVRGYNKNGPNWTIKVEHVFLCPACMEYKSWDCGCADSDPQICDDCWFEKVNPHKEVLDDRGTR